MFISKEDLAQEYRLREFGFKVGICQLNDQSLREREATLEMSLCKRMDLVRLLWGYFDLYEAGGNKIM